MKRIALVFLLFSQSLQAQTGSEIVVADIENNGGYLISNLSYATAHKGYDNQPFFVPGKPVIYYSSFNDSGRADIWMYNFRTGERKAITQTVEREYSPTLTPDGKNISCIIQRDNGAQDLGMYPVNGGNPTILIDNLKVGYHVWVSTTQLLLFVLESEGHNSLRLYNTTDKTNTVVAENPGRALHRIPGTNKFSFVLKVDANDWRIQEFDPITKTFTKIANCIVGHEDICWLDNKTILSSDGTNFAILDRSNPSSWQPVRLDDPSKIITSITRIASNGNGKIAFVVAE